MGKKGCQWLLTTPKLGTTTGPERGECRVDLQHLAKLGNALGGVRALSVLVDTAKLVVVQPAIDIRNDVVSGY